MKEFFEEPDLIQTKHGSSLFFRGTLLYSKYNPAKTILEQVSSLDVKENTLLIIASPVFDYGISELLGKLNATSFLLAIQPNPTLYNFTKKHQYENNFLAFQNKAENFSFLNLKSKNEFFQCLEELDKNYDFKRFAIITSSSLAVIDKEQSTFFADLKKIADDYLKEKHINRITLIKMGHGFSANFFKNLKYISSCADDKIKTINELKIDKPILILAAGPSLDGIMEKILLNRDTFFIIALDAVANATIKKLSVDAVIVLESQVHIANAFVGIHSKYENRSSSEKSQPFLFADVTSSPHVIKNWHGEIYFYFTEYTSANFLRRFFHLGLFNEKFQSVGSVGLSAIQVALTLRAGDEIPIFTAGLDFSYTDKFTHSKYSFQVEKNFARTSKLQPLFIPSNFFNDMVLQLLQGKKKVFTTKVLQSYASIFYSFLEKEKNIKALSSFTHKGSLSFEEACSLIKEQSKLLKKAKKQKTLENKKPINAIKNFLKESLEDLITIRAVLTGEKLLNDEDLESLILKNDFLFLHFPDYSKNMGKRILEKNFLTRIRIELEYFLKFLES